MKFDRILQFKLIKESINMYRNSDLGKRFFRGFIWNAAGVIASRALWLVATFFLARILTIEKFGELGIIQSTISMFGVFAGLGLGLTATKYLAELKFKDPSKAGRIISLTQSFVLIASLVFGLALFFLADWLSEYTLASPGLGYYLKISTLLLLFNSLNGVQIGILTGLENFKLIARANFINGILNIVLVLAGAYWLGLEGAIWGLVISIAITFLVVNYALKIEFAKYSIKHDLRGCLKESKIFWKFSVPALLSGVLVMPVNWICNALLVNQQSGYKEMGIYNAANQWFTVMVFLPNIVGSTILPILSEKIFENDLKRSKKLLFYSIIANFFLLLPIITIGALLSNQIMQLYGNEFAGNGRVLNLVLFTALMFSLQIPIGNYVAASGKMWIGFFMNLLWGIIFITFFLFNADSGSKGLALARLLAYAFLLIITLVYAIKLRGDIPNKTNLIKELNEAGK